MLDAGGKAGILQALHFLIDDFGDVLGVLAVLRANLVGVGLEGYMDAHGNHGLAVDVGKLISQLGVIGGTVGDVRLVDVAAPGVELTVGGEHHGHAQALGFGRSLQVVERIDNFNGGAVEVEKHAGKVEIRNQGAGRFQIGADAEQQAGFLFFRHLADQIVDTGVHVLAPVFVHIQLAILVHVLKLESVDLQNRGYALDIGQTGLLAIGFDESKTAVLRQQLGLGRTFGGGFFRECAHTAEHHYQRKKQSQFFHHQTLLSLQRK